jgi:hypothetical protein
LGAHAGAARAHGPRGGAPDRPWLEMEARMEHGEGLNFADVLGLIGAVLYLATYATKTMVPLRILGVASNIFLVGYAFLHSSYPTFLLYFTLIPLNSLRLYQMLELIKKVEAAASGDLNMDWLKPYMHKRPAKTGEILFRKGDVAEDMFYTVSGRYRLTESGIEIPVGRVVGELGLLSPGNQRTQTLECVEGGEIMSISYEKVKELYYQNPRFGFFFLRLTSERLMQNISRLEQELAKREKTPEAAPSRA